MKERPILFSGPMVLAILEGRKTQTRRVVKLDGFCGDPVYETRDGDLVDPLSLCPYGQSGDRLWVRETHGFVGGDRRFLQYAADFGGVHEEAGVPRWLPSIHMPRRASRLTLEIKSVRVERLQDISEADAKAEGVCCAPGHPHGSKDQHKGAFQKLWDSLNADRGFGWTKNPYVWVMEFRPIHNASEGCA